MNIENTLNSLGLSKNEAKIYETLLRGGEATVGSIASKANINRRNVYDAMNRLIEKGLVFEIVQKRESLYQAVNPKKLSEGLREKERELDALMPTLERLYGSTPHKDEVYIYKGVEGWKNYIRDIVRVGEDDYVIGGRGYWADPKLRPFMSQMIEQMKKKGITVHALFDPEVKEKNHEVVGMLGETNWPIAFLPDGFSTAVTIAVFGDHTVLLSDLEFGAVNEDASFKVIVNQSIADAFRTWFKLLWSMSEKPKKKR